MQQYNNNYANMNLSDLEQALQQMLQRENQYRNMGDQEYQRRRELQQEIDRRREANRMSNPSCFMECERRCGNQNY